MARCVIPGNLVIALCWVNGGVAQSTWGAERLALVEPLAVSAQGELLENAQVDIGTNTVIVDGQVVLGARSFFPALLLGPLAELFGTAAQRRCVLCFQNKSVRLRILPCLDVR